MRANEDPRDWHLLDFFCDDENSCALTVYSGRQRFHIIADAKNFCDKSDVSKSYNRLVRHHQRRLNGARNSPKDGINSTSPDSGVDLTADETQPASANLSTAQDSESLEEDLHSWMLQPLSSDFRNLSSSAGAKSEGPTVQQWYSCPTHFYELSVAQDDHRLQAIELEASTDLDERMERLLPCMSLPKYITDKTELPVYRASELIVLDESDQPIGTPFHPCRVVIKDTKETLFLKIVDNSQPQAVKRELRILNQITSLRLDKAINVPILKGLVAFDDAATTSNGTNQIMGFLQTDIPEAKPLTGMLDASIAQERRERWAEEAERLKEALHKENIIWGDAKADNFMVDANDELWIIDFGGSYTEGWVDPELNETKEGDDMGTEKTVNALHDPEENTFDPEKENKEDGNASTAGRKRKASAAIAEDSSSIGSTSKRRRQDEAGAASNGREE